MSYGEIFNTDEPEPWPSAEDPQEDNQMCICDHRFASHDRKRGNCMIPCCGCSKFDDELTVDRTEGE
jgi:hypothetical protein